MYKKKEYHSIENRPLLFIWHGNRTNWTFLFIFYFNSTMYGAASQHQVIKTVTNNYKFMLDNINQLSQLVKTIDKLTNKV